MPKSHILSNKIHNTMYTNKQTNTSTQVVDQGENWNKDPVVVITHSLDVGFEAGNLLIGTGSHRIWRC